MHVSPTSDLTITSTLSSVSLESGIIVFSNSNVLVMLARLSNQIGYCEENDYGG